VSNRKNIPRDIKRQVCIEAGYRCPVPNCGHEIGLDIHHIDGNKNNIGLENLLLLCAVHHRLATSGKMDRKACRRIKERLSIEHAISRMSDSSVTRLPTRKKYNDAVIEAIETGPKLLRAIIVGPHFLHPQWVMQRRLERERRKSFSLTIRNYLEESLHEHDRDIRLILRNSNRYPQILKPLVKQHEIHDVIREMKSNLHKLFFAPKSRSTISFCCTDPGHYHGVIITEKSCFVTSRKTKQSQIECGYELRGSHIVEMELVRFDGIFDASFKGQDDEVVLLEGYITSLGDLIYGIEDRE